MATTKSNELKPAKGSIKKRTRLGRGNASGHGGESGRGHKGQKSRSGYSSKPGFEGGQMPLYKRIPKNRGFKNHLFKTTYRAVNLGDIQKHFSDKEVVEINDYYDKNLASKGELIKILGDGEFNKKCTIQAHKASKSAQDKIAKSGAKLELA
ncbi:50S ribosomal protein L15 [bacterium]|mgnify:CR=1 FL=1|jgi:large subunit ribosomal protein L15|nr:50S ribosomal protein L15 [bacterium]